MANAKAIVPMLDNVLHAPVGVTVVVPTRNRNGFLLNCLRDLLSQQHRPLEILVVDQSDVLSPAIRALILEHADIITHHKVSFRNVSMARNFGWQHARYEAIVYIDDDTRCAPDLVSLNLASLQVPGIGLVGAAIDEVNRVNQVNERMGSYSRWTAVAHGGFGGRMSTEVTHICGTSFSLWRCIAEDLGGFDERLGIRPALYEETDLPVRACAAGYRIWFNADCRVKHLAAPNGGNRAMDIAQYVRILSRNRSIMIRRHSEPYQFPIALAVTAKLTLAYAWGYKRPKLIAAGLHGALQGWSEGGKPPRCTFFGRDGTS